MISDMNDKIEASYAAATPLAHRKKYAQFFTPAVIADLMADWLALSEGLRDVLEPAFGLGVLTRHLLRKRSGITIKGFDIDENILGWARDEFRGCANVGLSLQDYIYSDWENKYDGIICNPPYFKFHDYDNKHYIQEIERRMPCRLNGFTNLYTLFLMKSIFQLRRNGRCAYVVPSEFMNSDYGVMVKDYLLRSKTLRHVIVFDFEENVFDGVLTTACIILCANDGNCGKVKFTTLRSLSDISLILQLIREYPITSGHDAGKLNPSVKWREYYQEQHPQKFKNLVPFTDYAVVMRGIATGANDYFTFSQSKADAFGIGGEYLLPCVCKCTDVQTATFSPADFDKLRDDDKKAFLLNATDASDQHVREYIEKGKRDGIDKRYLTSKRNPWFILERRAPSPIWVTVFNRTGPRFVRNTAGVSNLTTFHCVYPARDMFRDVSVSLLFAYLISNTAKEIFNRNRREYGNGLQKFEPGDINKSMMLDIDKLPRKAKKEMESLCPTEGHGVKTEAIDGILRHYFGEAGL